MACQNLAHRILKHLTKAQQCKTGALQMPPRVQQASSVLLSGSCACTCSAFPVDKDPSALPCCASPVYPGSHNCLVGRSNTLPPALSTSPFRQTIQNVHCMASISTEDSPFLIGRSVGSHLSYHWVSKLWSLPLGIYRAQCLNTVYDNRHSVLLKGSMWILRTRCKGDIMER